MNIPALRFKEFEMDWETKTLISLSENGFSNGAFNDPKKVGSGYRIINVKDMYIDGTINIDSLNRVAIDAKEFSKNRVEYGDIFFTRSSLVKEGIAYSNVNLNISDDLTFDGHLIRMRPKKDLYSPVFLYYNFSTSKTRQQFIIRGKTATMTTIGQEDIAQVIIRVPSLPEQQKIASSISAVDEKIQQLALKKVLLEQYKKGVMQQLFSGKLRFKDQNGEDYPDWEETKLGEVGSFRGGGTPIKEGNNWNGTIPWISSSDLLENDIHNIRVDRFINEDAIEKSATKLIPKESVLLVSRVGVGKLAINKIEMCTSQDFINFIPFKVNCYFLGYLFLLKKNLLLSLCQGTSIKGFIKSDLESLKIKFPSSIEQQKIASFLSAIDTKIETVTKQINKTQTFKKGLLQQMFV